MRKRTFHRHKQLDNILMKQSHCSSHIRKKQVERKGILRIRKGHHSIITIIMNHETETVAIYFFFVLCPPIVSFLYRQNKEEMIKEKEGTF